MDADTRIDWRKTFAHWLGRYVFTPCEDITAYELAQCINLIDYGRHWNGWAPTPGARVAESPPTVQRHFTKEESSGDGRKPRGDGAGEGT